jgi:hypothetical protein
MLRYSDSAERGVVMLTFLIWTTIVSFGFVLMGLVADRPLGREYDDE